jgi:zinc protease
MNNHPKPLTIVVFATLALLLTGPALGRGQGAGPPRPDEFALGRKLPVDSRITTGQLENGLRYWIRENREPKNRADLRLVVHAGSVLEDKDQRGLAHLVEHLAFNGSEHFPRQALVDFMESIGMRFGPDLNAFTGFDQTVYMLKIPMDSEEILEKSFLILEDWAHGLTFDPAAVDKERGIVIEEWRLGQGAAERMRAKQFPVLFRGSRYAERMPIGTKETIETAGVEALKRFYRAWYRPDLMAVIAVGDFDRTRILDLIRKHFAGIPRAKGAPARPVYPVPRHNDLLFAVATDREETNSSVAVYHKLPVADQSKVASYRRMLVERLFDAMLNARFAEIAQKPGAPFLGAASSKGRLVESKEVYALSALVPEGGIARGLQALYAEGERVARFGFTETELERQKSEMLRAFERAFTERATEVSGDLAEEFTRSFLEEEPTPGIAWEYEAHKRFMPKISLEEIDRLAKEWMTGPNRVVVVNAPEKAGVPVPTGEELASVLESIKTEKLAAYKDTTTDKPLLPEMPEPGSIVSTRSRPEIGVTEWTLSNGARVIFKPTDFKKDEILMRAMSPGGISLAADENLIPANTADQVVSSGGLGAFSALDLEKKLAGKAVFVRPTIGELDEGLAGTTSPRDVESLFQMIYLTFTAPRPDPGVFEVMKAQLKAFLENRTKSPEVVFSDTLRTTMQRDQPRFRPMTVDEIPKMDIEKSFSFYRDRFADASDFTFVFVGNLDLEAIRLLVCRYLASLPSLRRTETWKDWRVPPPEGVVKRTVEMGVESKSLTAVMFSGPFSYTLANRNAIGAASQVLETRLRKLLREKLSGTYSVSVKPSVSKIPREEFRVSIELGADPKRIDELSRAIFEEIGRLQTVGPDEEEVKEIRMAESRDYETSSRQNGWWLSQLSEQYRLEEDPAEVLRIPAALDLITKDVVREAARMYFNTERYVQVTLYPEKQ